jgi:filamentous hemagglutinin family protein
MVMKAVCRRKFCIVIALVVEGAIAQILLGLGFKSHVLAQSITLDGTLSPARTLTGASYRIRQADGRTVDRNLFHSFGRFNLTTGESATFESAPDIRNIITRVTGGSPSAIDGLIQTESNNVNLFMINPSGIVFGRNASLNIGGSFVASTANAIEFGNQGFFSASVPNDPSALLIINPSALLFNRINAKAIVNRSIASAGVSPSGNNIFGLRVSDGQSLLLVGGDVTLDGGRIEAFGGRVEIGGLSGIGTVALNSNGSLKFPDEVAQSNVILTNAVIDTMAGGGGSIAINARNFNASQASILQTGIGSGLGNANSQAGDISLNATGQIQIDRASLVLNFIGLGAMGNAGDIRINTGSISLLNASRLENPIYGTGNAGRVIINARDTVSFNGGDSTGFTSGIFNDVNETGIGQGGNVQIHARAFSLTNGATISASLYGRGNAGDIIINARDAVVIKGFRRIGDRILTSGIFSNIQTDAQGNGGTIQIMTNALSVSNSAELDVGNFGRGNAGTVIINARDTAVFDSGNIFSDVEENAIGQGGSIRINTGSLFLRRGAELVTTTRSQGNAGSVIINARDRVFLEGEGTSLFQAGMFPSAILSDVGQTGLGQGGDVQINAGVLSVTGGAELSVATSGKGDAGNILINARNVTFDGVSGNGRIPSFGRSAVTLGAIGDGGDIQINATSLSLTNSAQLSSSSVGQGIAGRIEIGSRSVLLDNQAALFARTASGRGGNIALNAQDLLLLRHSSQISATAGTAQSGGNGGNISINSNFIVAVPSENSDITANAFTGRGGIARINTQGIFGIQSRSQLTSQSDITASSERGIQGVVTINTPDVDPSRGLIELPANVVDRSTQIALGCTPRGQESGRFVVTGRGGLPLSPDEALRDRAVLTPEWVTVDATTSEGEAVQRSSEIETLPQAAESTPADAIVEANGWTVNAQGKVALIDQSRPLDPVQHQGDRVCLGR